MGLAHAPPSVRRFLRFLPALGRRLRDGLTTGFAGGADDQLLDDRFLHRLTRRTRTRAHARAAWSSLVQSRL